MKMGIREKKDMISGTMLLMILSGILLVRCFYSFSWSDESLYMAEVHRLYLEERPFADEWHPTQFYASLLLPLYRIYVGIVGSTEGIYLWARIFNLVLAFLAAEISYLVLKKYFQLENYFAITGGAMVILYSRANVGGISYHNFFFFCFIISVMLLYVGVSCYRTKAAWYKYVMICLISGLIGGMAIIAIPTSVVSIGILYLGLGIYAISNKLLKKYQPIWIHLGGAISTGILYLFFIFSRIDLVELIDFVPFLFMDDQHQQKKLLVVINNIKGEVSYYGEYILKIIVILCIIRIVFMISHTIVKEKVMIGMYMVAVLATALNIYQRTASHLNAYLMFALLGFAMIVICYKSELKKLIRSDVNIFLIIPGIAYLLSVLLASATIDPIYGGCVVLGLGSLNIIAWFQKNLQKNKYRIAVKCITIGMLLLMIGVLLYTRIITVYRDAPLDMLNFKITSGPAKGLWTTKEHVEQYDECLEVMDYINELEYQKEDSMVISVIAPWMYLCTNIHNGAASPWRIYLDDPLMAEYYQYHDIKSLKYVIVLNEDIGNYIDAGAVEGTDSAPNMNMCKGFLYEHLKGGSFKQIEFGCGTLYVRDDIG